MTDICYNPCAPILVGGNPVVNARIFFYTPATVNPKTVYSDEALSIPLPSPVTCDANGFFPQVYFDDGKYDIVCLYAAGNNAEIFKRENVEGNIFKDLVASISDLNSTNTAVKSVTANYSLIGLDRNKTLKCDCTAQAITISLLPANTAGNGYKIQVLKEDNTGNVITIAAASGETINGTATKVLNEQYGYLELISDGVGWFLQTNYDENYDSVGDVKQVWGVTPPDGWVVSHGTIGNASSNATTRANTDTLNLFTFFWNKYSTWPVYNSSGTVVTRLATAALDFADNRALVMIDTRGCVIQHSATTAADATITGSDTAALAVANMPNHTHTINVTNPAHTHAISDPGHLHTYESGFHTGDSNSGTGNDANKKDPATTNTSSTTTGITVTAATTAVTAVAVAAGSGTAFSIQQRAINLTLCTKL